MEDHNLVKNTLDQIPQVNSNAKWIVRLVKEGGRITGYQLSDNSIVEKQQAVNMAKQGQIAGVGIAHRGDTEYLKSIPDGSDITTSVTFLPFLLMPKDNNLTDSIPRNAVGLFFVYSSTKIGPLHFSPLHTKSDQFMLNIKALMKQQKQKLKRDTIILLK